MIVVSDTSPLNYLILTGYIDLLPELYGEVKVPPAVIEELTNPKAPERVRQWMGNLPGWIEVRAPNAATSQLAGLGRGESQAIALAAEVHADLLLMDEAHARAAALAAGVDVVGTLGVLELASERKRLDFVEAVKRLKATNCRIAVHLYKEALERRSRGGSP